MQILQVQSVALIIVDVPSIRFQLERFCNDLAAQHASSSLFLLLNKGMRLDRLPRASGYLRRPFTRRQLLNRITRILPEQDGETIAWRELQLNTGGNLLVWQGLEIPLTPKQAALVQIFLENPEKLLSRVRLMREVWGTSYMGDTRTLDVHIHWLRKAIEKLGAPFTIKTKRGKGYRIVCNQSED
ncbi:MAG TPA: response regulator transcription factor [Chloroflexi bacterium]|nr:response regulator transcription factor [Chloroflexota bacterium]